VLVQTTHIESSIGI